MDVMLFLSVALPLLVNQIGGVWSQPIDSFDDEIPLSDMDILTENNPLETDEGEPLVEGDMILPPVDHEDGNDVDDELQARKGILNILSLWPSGRVAYNFHSSVSRDTREKIRLAMDEWENRTCLRFHETLIDFNYLRFRTDKSGCWSLVGRQNRLFSGQDVSIGPGCERVPVIVHEIGHAIGMFHEQSRLDRDGYVTILWNNIPPGLTSQFSTNMDYPRGVEYDYTSIMHYSSMAFTKQLFVKNTIVTKNPHYQRLLGSGRVISFRDAKLANKMYSCSSFCPNLLNETQQCQNDGYMAPYRGDGKPCPCVCPPGATGEFCETVIDEEYYRGNHSCMKPWHFVCQVLIIAQLGLAVAVLYSFATWAALYTGPPICGGNITEETSIQTPGYPNRESPNDSCSWWFQAPRGKRVMVTFEDFSFYPRLASRTSKYRGRCVTERVEIRTRNMAEGNMFCGEDIKPGTNLASTGQQFIIIITSNGGMRGTRGLKAKVSFI